MAVNTDNGRSASPSGHSVCDPSPEGLGHPASVPNAVREETFALEITFGGVGVNISREAHQRIVDGVNMICAEYEARHPDRVMWTAGFGAKMLCHPLALSDDEPIPFDDSVEVIECCERERFQEERQTPFWDEVAELRRALVAHNDALRSAQAVIARRGEGTNWPGTHNAVMAVLNEHHKISNRARAASGIETEGGNAVPSRSDESPTAESGDAQQEQSA